MIGHNQDPNDIDDNFPQLKFKVPNFMGTLMERKRPKFESMDEDTPTPSRYTDVEPQNHSRYPEVEREDENIQPSPRDSLNVQFQHTAPLTTQVHPTHTQASVEVHDAKSIMENIKPIELFKKARSIVNDVQEVKIQGHANDVQNTIRQPFQESQPPIPQLRPSSHANEITQKPQLSAMGYGHESDKILKDIVSLLGSLRSLGKHGYDQSILLESQLRLEQENRNQLISMIEIERRSKDQVESDFSETRREYEILENKYLEMMKLKGEMERKVYELEAGMKATERNGIHLRQENLSLVQQLESIKPELDRLQIELAVLGNQKVDLENELCKNKASLQEQEVRLNKELKVSIQKFQEMKDELAKQKTEFESFHLNSLQQQELSFKESMEHLRGGICTFLKELEIEHTDNASNEEIVHLLTSQCVQRITELKASTLNTERALQELQELAESKQKAIEHLQKSYEKCSSDLVESNNENEHLRNELKENTQNNQSELRQLKGELEKYRCNESIRSDEHENFLNQICSLLTIKETKDIQKKLIVLLKTEEDFGKQKEKCEELRAHLETEKESNKTRIEEEQAKWTQERQRMQAERYRLVQENETLKRRITPDTKAAPAESGSEMTADIMRAIEADLAKSKGISASQKQAVDESWTVSDSIKSPSKRPVPSKVPGRSKRANKSKSPMPSKAPSELDFWAFARD